MKTQDFEAINAEQLVTKTDRVLFGTVRRREPLHCARGSSRTITHLPFADERTELVRIRKTPLPLRPRPTRPTRNTSIGFISRAATITWLAVVFICLLS